MQAHALITQKQQHGSGSRCAYVKVSLSVFISVSPANVSEMSPFNSFSYVLPCMRERIEKRRRPECMLKQKSWHEASTLRLIETNFCVF